MKNVLKLNIKGVTHTFFDKKPLTVEQNNHWLLGEVSFEGEPRISPLGEISFSVKLSHKNYNVYQLTVRVMTPEGWSAKHPKAVTLHHLTAASDSNLVWHRRTHPDTTFNVTLTAGETTEAFNRVYIAIEAQGYPEPLVIPVTVLG